MSEEATRQLFDLVRDLKAELTRLNALLEVYAKRVEEQAKDIETLKLKEAKRSGVLATIAAVAGVIGAAVGAVVGAIVKHLFFGGNN